jgi:hypothetical protein
MWEADFGAVDEAISDGFDEDERLVVLWVQDDLLDFALERYVCQLVSSCLASVNIPGLP